MNKIKRIINSKKVKELIIINIILTMAYTMGGLLSVNMASLAGKVTAVWLPSGITLAAILYFGFNILPAIIIGSFIVISQSFTGEVISIDAFIVINIGCILGNCLQPVTAYLIIRKFTNIKNLFTKVTNIIIFVIAGFFSPIISALFGVTSAAIFHYIPRENYGISILTWWIASGLAHLTITPAFLVWKSKNFVTINKSQYKLLLGLLIIILTSLVSWLTFFNKYPFEYILLPLLLGTVLIFGKRFSTIMVVIISGLAIYTTNLGLGVFARENVNESLLLVQSFIGVFSLTSLILSATIDEKIIAKNELEKTLLNLEDTIRKRTLELEKAKDKAEAANKAKSIFIANMSHELRTPLNAVLGFSQIMVRSPNLSSEEKENIMIINRSGEYLLTLINDILDLAKIEAGKISFNPTNFDLFALLNEIEDLFALKTDLKGLQLIFEQSETIPRYVCTDEVKLRQVLINVLGNAVKFTDKGSILLTVNSKKIGENHSKISFTIEDTGVGIAAEELETIFENFTQSASGKNVKEGSGLGLAISRQFVQLMGGDIKVKSVLNQGTNFTFDILVIEVTEEIIKNKPLKRKIINRKSGQPCYKILIVDDKTINRQLLIKILQPLGFQLEEAKNGEEAVKIWKKWQPDLIFMDIRMSVIDGCEATQLIKEHSEGKNTVIIAVTASVLEEEKAAVLEIGCDDFIRKPFRESTIFYMLEKYLGVNFIYEDITEESEAKIKPININNNLLENQIKTMDKPWVLELYKAALNANVKQVKQLIENTNNIPNELTNILINWAENFEFEKILNLTKTVIYQ